MQGQLFSQDFLTRGICEMPPYEKFTDNALIAFRERLSCIFQELRADSVINEAQTEQIIIERVLSELGWGSDYLPQVNLSGKRREDVPDILLFPNSETCAAALAETRDDRRYRHGLAILEAKRWLRPLDRGDNTDPQDPGAPSSQMLRYLSRAEVVSDRAVKWGILTNGGLWRLYWQDARSRSEEFFELNIAAALGVPGVQSDLEIFDPDHTLRLFFLLFHRTAFLDQYEWDEQGRSFHAIALNEARRYEERVSQDLGGRVFSEIFPAIAQALAKGDLQARTQVQGSGKSAVHKYTRDYLDEIRESALILLYRLLFLFYAEDRFLLPVRDPRYEAYSVRRLRERVRHDIDAGRPLASRLDNLWRDLQGVFYLIDQGDDAVGIPAYNGGLFDRARAPLLERTRVPDAIMAPIIDALSRRTEDVLHAWINYRDLSVSHLGGIYERLLEYTLEHEVQAGDDFGQKEVDRVVARPASFARKASGSYYTHDDLVRLLVRESVGRLASERLAAFETRINWLKRRSSLSPADWDGLDRLDPASAFLELTVCDPAMGSGHFLVSLVDDLADRVLEAVNIAEHVVFEQPWAAHLIEMGRPWQSPLVARIAHIRRSIKTEARQHGWAVTDAHLDDRHIVRRMILKKVIFGVDKNPMAVELAKTALWLHTFTVGAPLSFLDHHLVCGDSLHGEHLPYVANNLNSLGMLFQQGEMRRLEFAASSLAKVADLTDIDIAEARLSKRLAGEAAEQVAPIHALLDFWRALRWILPGWPTNSAKNIAKMGENSTSAGLAEILSPQRNLVGVLFAGKIEGSGYGIEEANRLLAHARALAKRESFFHWWTNFPTIFDAQGIGGFDVVLGNPPWDRIKLQEVEWFAERDAEIALQSRAADRKRMIIDLEKKKSPLWHEYQKATARAEANARVLSKGGDYPLLGGGDVNLYSLFIERAQSLVKPSGLVALLTPSGIAADKGAAEFFRSISATGRLGCLFDFENRQNPGGSYFPDVDSRFKFCALIFGGAQRTFDYSRCAFYLHNVNELDDHTKVLQLSATDFQLVNPNTGSAPIFRNQRDADLVRRIYRENPVLVELNGKEDRRSWPVKYCTMFHMTNDSRNFLTADALELIGFVPTSLNRWHNGKEEAVPLYEGKMVQMYDHRASDVVLNMDNLHRAAQPEVIPPSIKTQPDRYPKPQYYVLSSQILPKPIQMGFGIQGNYSAHKCAYFNCHDPAEGRFWQ